MTASTHALCAVFAFIGGMAWGTYYSYASPILLVLVLFCGFFAIVLRSPWRIAFLVIASCLGGLIYTIYWRNSFTPVYEFGPSTFTGIIRAPPDVREYKILLTIEPNNLSKNHNKGLVLATMPRFPNYYKFGDQVTIVGDLEQPEAFDNFNYPRYLERQHIFAVMRRPKVEVIGHTSFLSAPLFKLRTFLETKLQLQLPEPEASLAAGLLLGSRRTIPEDVQDDLRITGTTHIIAISGSNITIMLGMFLYVLPLYKRRSQLIATGCIGLFIVIITGASASVVRGAAMAFISLYIRSQSRRLWPLNYIVLSMAALLLYNPLMLVADPGFQLSFGAFTGIAFLSSPLNRLRERATFLHRFPEAITATFTETAAATFGTLPISWFYFRNISLLGLLVNPLILWMIPIATLCAAILALLPTIPIFSVATAMLTWVFLHAVLGIITSFALINRTLF